MLGEHRRPTGAPRRRRAMLAVVVAAVAAVAVGGAVAVADLVRDDAGAPEASPPPAGSPAGTTPTPSPSSRSPAATPGSPLPSTPGPVTVQTPGWWSWALLDRSTGEIIGAANHGTQTNTTESMIKAWIGADYLAGVVAAGRAPTASELSLIRIMIRNSDDDAAQTLYLRRGGNAVVQRMITTCGLTETTIRPGWWSLTRVSARDAVRMGQCIASGKVAGPQWTAWLLDEMRRLAPDNAFGIPEVAPASWRVAVKNGWTAHGSTDSWHVNCLGITDDWVFAVLTRYPVELGQKHGAAICRSVTKQVFALK